MVIVFAVTRIVFFILNNSAILFKAIIPNIMIFSLICSAFIFIHDSYAVYRSIQRERVVCQEAINITNVNIAKGFYNAANESRWKDSFRIIKWVFRPIVDAFGELSDKHIEQLNPLKK